MLRAGQELAGLDAAKLRKGAVRRFISPDSLRGGEHRVAAIALLIIAIVLIAVNDDFIADLPALDLRADCPNHTGSIGAGDVKRILVPVDGGHRCPQRRPDSIVVNAGRHDEHQHLVVTHRPGWHDFDLHGARRRAVAFLPDGPSVHSRRHMAHRRNIPDFIEIGRNLPRLPARRRVWGR